MTYTNPHRWLPGFRPDDGDAALRTLVARYLYAYGPATPAALRPMAQHPAAARRRAVRRAGRRAGARSSWTDSPPGCGPATPRRRRGPSRRPPAALLRRVRRGRPARDRLYPGAAATRALAPTGQAGNYPVLLVDGVVGGVWHHAALGPEGRRHRRTAARVDRASSAASSTTRSNWSARSWRGPTLTIGPVTVGPHA